MRKFVLYLSSILIILSSTVFPQSGKYRSGTFFAHSTGTAIWGPNGSSTSVLQEIVNYNRTHGLSGSDSVRLVKNDWPTTPWENEWERWHRIFDNTDATADIRPYLSTNKIIMIKSCFPSSSITSEGTASDTLTPTAKTIYNYKWHWRHFIAAMRDHPENFFVVWTGAAQCEYANPIPSWSIAQGERAHRFNKWAKDTLAAGLDPVFGPFPSNIYVFDFFHKYATLATSWLNPYPEYAKGLQDAHPNAALTALVAPQLVQEVFDAAISYESGVSIPSIPNLSKPVNGSQLWWNSPRLSWRPSMSASNYCLQLSRDSLFETLEINDTTLTDTSKVVGSLAIQTKYFWRVRSKNTAGTSDWSASWSFRIVLPPIVPTLIYPVNGSVDQPNIQTIRWNKSAYASNYYLQVSSDSTFNALAINDSTIVDTFKYVGPLEDLKKYYWRIKSKNSSGSSQWSNYWEFTTSSFTFQYSYHQGWNLMSLPLIVADSRISNLFPNVKLTAYGYNGSYFVNDSIKQGYGYWMKFDQDGIVGFSGIPVSRETIDVAVGWNLIGSIGNPIFVASITSQPEGVVTSGFYGYNTSYAQTDSIFPGKGYWVKVDQNCKLILTTGGIVRSSAHINIVPTQELPPSQPGELVNHINDIPKEYTLSQNYPNPFNPQTTIDYTIPESKFVKLIISNLLGQDISILVNEVKTRGYNRVTFDAGTLPSGIYFYRLEAGEFIDVKKMVLMK